MTEYVRNNVLELVAHGLKRRWYLIILGATMGSVILFAISFRIIPQYQSESKMLPNKASSGMGQLSQLAALAGLGSAKVGSEGGIEMYYEDLVYSEMLLDSLLDKKWRTSQDTVGKPLSALFRVDTVGFQHPNTFATSEYQTRMELLSALRRAIVFKKEASGVMTLSVSTFDPLFSEDLNREIVRLLTQIAESDRFNQSKTNRIYIGSQLEDYQSKLASAEEALAAFIADNRNLGSPLLQLRQKRLASNVAILDGLVLEMRKQLELGKIEENKTQVTLRVINEPSFAIYRSKPKRKEMAALGFAFGAILSSLILGISVLLKPVRC